MQNPEEHLHEEQRYQNHHGAVVRPQRILDTVKCALKFPFHGSHFTLETAKLM